MRILTVFLAALVFFLGGMMTGVHVSEQYRIESSAISSEAVEEPEDAPAPSSAGKDTAEELLERQQQIKESKKMNIFSDIGKSLDVFDSPPDSRSND
ncbi:hypothetical protein [Salibacterium sp. K-3]